ncbi:hypothetical protein GCM10027024_27790 [Microbacterium insulae]
MRVTADVVAIVVLLATMGVCLAWVIFEQPSWDEDAQGSYSSIGIVGTEHVPLRGGGFVTSDPSLDLWVLQDDDGNEGLAGIFRINPVGIDDNDDAAKVGLILPLRSQFTVGGVGPPGQMVVVQSFANPDNEPRPLSCAASEMPGTDDANEMGVAMWQGLEWTAECLPEATVIWTHLPREPKEDAGWFADDSQRVMTSTAGMIDFRIPAFDGVTRTTFDTWTFKAHIESGRLLPGTDIQPPDDLLPGITPVLALHDSGEMTVHDPRPRTDRAFRPWLDIEAHTWEMPLDGRVVEYSATLTKRGEHSARQVVGFLAPALAAIALTGLPTWVYRRFRPASRR